MKQILRACNIKKTSNSLQRNLLNSRIKIELFDLATNGTSEEWQMFLDFIQRNYTQSMDKWYLQIFQSSDIQSFGGYFYVIFTHWLVIKLKRSPLSLLDSAQSAEIVSLIIESIKWNEGNYDDILEPLWKNFVAQRLFVKLSCCMKRKDDHEYLQKYLFLNRVICAYLSVFCTNDHLANALIYASEDIGVIIIPQIIFYNIMSRANLYEVTPSERRRYFYLWFDDQRMKLINHAWYDADDAEFEYCRKNSEIIQCFLCSLLDEGVTSEMENVLQCALVKDRILSYQAKLRRDKVPIYGYYVTVDVIKAMMCRASAVLADRRLDTLVSDTWCWCTFFKRTDLIWDNSTTLSNINSSFNQKLQRPMGFVEFLKSHFGI